MNSLFVFSFTLRDALLGVRGELSVCLSVFSANNGSKVQTPLLDFLKKRKEERRMAYQVRHLAGWPGNVRCR